MIVVCHIKVNPLGLDHILKFKGVSSTGQLELGTANGHSRILIYVRGFPYQDPHHEMGWS